MTTQPGGPPGARPTITCPVCGTENPSARQFCIKCASELRPGSVPPSPPPPGNLALPLGIAAAVLILVALAIGAYIVLSGSGPSPSPSASAAPSAEPSAIPSAEPSLAASAAPIDTTAPTPGPQKILTFKGPASVNCSDASFPGTIHLTWTIANATGVDLSIDGTGIFTSYTGTSGADDVPFACSDDHHTYVLTTTGGVGTAATKTKTVTRSSP